MLFKFVGGELVDPMVPDSVVEFHFSLFAKNLVEATDAFYEIFPSCFILSYTKQAV